jgi:hypothetical protein
MFIACGGLPSLVGLLLPPHSSHDYYIATRPLLYTAIECIKCVFDITVTCLSKYVRCISPPCTLLG